MLVLDLPNPSLPFSSEISEAFARVLRCRSVVQWDGGIEGEFRTPRTRHLWGDNNTETVHVENGIRYRFDPKEIMWSPGNLNERHRLAAWDCRDQVVADYFAGIGYWALPLAVHAKARRVVAIEKNPRAAQFLVENIRLNGVEGTVMPLLGDNRDVAPQGVADRVLLGYLHDTPRFLAPALRTLKPEGGFLHVHAKLPEEDFPEFAYQALLKHIEPRGWTARLTDSHRVKSYAPRIVHGVLDLEVRPSAS